jgi:hypothetical protein
MKFHRNVKLRVEELESRLLPSAGTPWPSVSSNWSGYSVDSAAGAVSDVRGSWTVPRVTVSSGGNKYAATWLGIDGDNSNTVEQIGTDSDQKNGQPVYYAWYEMYPANYFYINWATKTGIPASSNVPAAALVGVGDTMCAEVQFLSSSGNTSTFRLTVTDTPAGGGTPRTFSTDQTIKTPAQSSAEWIVEQTGTLSNFSPTTFTNAQATIQTTNGVVTGTIRTFLQGDSSTVVNKINIVANNKKTYVDNTGDLNSTGDGFTVYYGAMPPSSAGVAAGGGMRGAMERLADDPVVAGVVAPRSSAAQTTVINASATPTNPSLATQAVVPAAFSLAFGRAEGTLGRSVVVVRGVLAGGEEKTGAGLSWFDVTPMPETTVTYVEAPGHGEAMVGGVPFDSHLQPFATASSPFEQSPVALSSLPAFSEDAHSDRLFSALALVAFVPYLQRPRTKEELSRVR